jgi:hypothetical protein
MFCYMTDRKLQKHGDRDSYFITVAKDLVEQLDWKPGDKIKQDLQIGGRGAGALRLEKIEKEDE